MKVVIDWLRCDGNGACAVEAPEIFALTDDDELEVLLETPPEELRGKLQAALEACPKRAIAIED